MAPGPFSGLLAPFIGARKSKKYEKLQTEDPEKKRQEATQDEINRLHSKIVSLYLFDTHSIGLLSIFQHGSVLVASSGSQGLILSSKQI